MLLIYLLSQKRFYCLFSIFLISWGNISAQENDFTDNKSKFQLKIKKTTEAILLDGKLEEAVWKDAETAKDFWIKYPKVKPGANPKSEAKVTYNDKYIYVGIKCYGKNDYIIPSLKRDQDYWNSDAIGIILDPFGESANGFMFGVSPLGVQMEGLLSSSGNDSNIDRNWDNKWFSATQVYEDYWTVEMAIPFKTLRFDASKTEWGINFIRNNPKDSEFHTWTSIPQQFDGIDLNYLGTLAWDVSPQKVKRNISIIPYLTGGLNHDIANGKKMKGNINAGVEAKVSLTSSLNLDLTINPDFSQIEVDQQVTNLTRFSIFLPEKRTFFLENADIFSTFGIGPLRPFFSRKIGLNSQGETVPILFGARLSGNLNAKTRIGILNMQTKGNDSQVAQNYSAAAVHRRIGKRSLLKGIFTNRQSNEGGDFDKNDYGRNASIEMTTASNDGKWQAWGGYHHSFAPDVSDKNNFYGGGGGYFTNKVQFFTDTYKVNENYNAELGFINRLDNFYRDTTIRSGFIQNFTQLEYFIFPDNDEVVNVHRFGWENFLVYFPDGTLSERSIRLRYFMSMKNSSDLKFRVDNTKNNLLDELTFAGVDTVKAGIYNNYQFNIQYESDDRKLFNYEIFFKHGGFYEGTLTTYRFSVNYRRQPWGNINLGLEKNDIRFPNYELIDLVDLTSRIEVNFSKKIFWTTFTQYNFQNNQFNINSRLQYRFSPMSDFFVVYTDNYDVLNVPGARFLENVQAKNRALVFKLNYWFSL
jgi:hypothetical protein